MATNLVVPTRNRPKQMQDFLAFFSKFYPNQRITVLDGSSVELQPVVRDICSAAASTLDISFNAYPHDLPLFERMLDGIMRQSDEILTLSADDDFPIMETFDEASRILDKSQSLAAVVPFDIVLNYSEEKKLTARLSGSRSVMQQSAAKRVEMFSRWHYATSYGAVRKKTMLARYSALSQNYCAGFIDYQIGMEDCLSGKIKALPKLGSLRTHAFTGSYLRPADKLVFLRRSEEVLKIAEHISNRLVEVEGLSPQHAQSISNAAMTRQIGTLVGANPLTRRGFTESSTFLAKDVQEQFRLFYSLFQEGSETRKTFLDRLSFVTKALIAQTQKMSKDASENYEVL